MTSIDNIRSGSSVTIAKSYSEKIREAIAKAPPPRSLKRYNGADIVFCVREDKESLNGCRLETSPQVARMNRFDFKKQLRVKINEQMRERWKAIEQRKLVYEKEMYEEDLEEGYLEDEDFENDDEEKVSHEDEKMEIESADNEPLKDKKNTIPKSEKINSNGEDEELFDLDTEGEEENEDTECQKESIEKEPKCSKSSEDDELEGDKNKSEKLTKQLISTPQKIIESENSVSTPILLEEQEKPENGGSVLETIPKRLFCDGNEGKDDDKVPEESENMDVELKILPNQSGDNNEPDDEEPIENISRKGRRQIKVIETDDEDESLGDDEFEEEDEEDEEGEVSENEELSDLEDDDKPKDELYANSRNNKTKTKKKSKKINSYIDLEAGEELDEEEENDEEGDGEDELDDEDKVSQPGDFILDEAEVSGSESSDDDDGSDIAEFMDDEGAEKVNTEKERKVIQKVYQKELLNEDKRMLLQLQERYLEDGDLHSDHKRVKKFRWSTAGNAWLDNARDYDTSSEEEDDDEDEENIPVFRLNKVPLQPTTTENITTETQNLTLPSTARPFNKPSGSITSYLVRDKKLTEILSTKRNSNSPEKSRSEFKRLKPDYKGKTLFDLYNAYY